MEEIWKEINGFEGFYSVSNKGQVKSLTRFVKHNYGGLKEVGESVLKTSLSNGYRKVILQKDGKTRKTIKVSRLVAFYFVDNPENKPYVNHKNGIKTDDEAKNLEWVTAQENTLHAVSTGLFTVKKGEENPMYNRTGLKSNSAVKVICTVTRRILAVNEAAKTIGHSHQYLSKMLLGQRPNKTTFVYYEK